MRLFKRKNKTSISEMLDDFCYLSKSIISFSNKKEDIITNNIWVDKYTIILSGVKICDNIILSADNIIIKLILTYNIIVSYTVKIYRFFEYKINIFKNLIARTA